MIDLDETFLPTGRMRQISRVTARDGHAIEAEVDLGPDHWVYPNHFPGDPVFPGCLLIEAAGQIVALWAWTAGARGRPRLVKSEARFIQPVRPRELRLRLSGDVRRRGSFYLGDVLVSMGDEQAATVSIVLSVQPEE